MGSLVYLTIVGYSDSDFSKKINQFVAVINPDTYSQDFKINYSEVQATGELGTTIKYDKTLPSTISFELVFDGTGVVSDKEKDNNLLKQIDILRRTVYEYNGENHSPNYLKLTWGKGLRFRCRLTSLSIKYTLFKSDGTPLRARANVTFKNYLCPNEIAKKADKQSPDMTHEVIVVAGDTLPELTNKIYGDHRHYLKVAKYNKLYNFRTLKSGSKLFFPPLI